MPLNPRQFLFSQEIAAGKSLTDSYVSAYPAATREAARSAAARLAKHPEVSQEIVRLRGDIRKETVLSAVAKREFLAGIIQQAPSDPPKISDQIRCIEIDNKMAGHNFNDQDDSAGNAFSVIVNLSKSMAVDTPAIEMASSLSRI